MAQLRVVGKLKVRGEVVGQVEEYTFGMLAISIIAS